MEGSLYWL
ncbi:hypothetical protein YPPY91_3406, partial [Yersinia pestis PY-91]